MADGDTSASRRHRATAAAAVADAAEGWLGADAAAGATTLEVEEFRLSTVPFVPPVRVEINAGGATAEVVTVVGLGNVTAGGAGGRKNDHAAGERVTALPDDNAARVRR